MRQRRLKNEINVVPYIDVMLVLLVIFMVATPMMTTGSIELPGAGTGSRKPDKFLRVQIDKDGSLVLFDTTNKEQKLNDTKSLNYALKAEIEKTPDVAVLVAGDQAVAYRKIAETLEAVRQTGFKQVALETRIP